MLARRFDLGIEIVHRCFTERDDSILQCQYVGINASEQD